MTDEKIEDINGDGEEYLFQLNRLDTSGTILNTSGLQESPVFPNLPTGNYTIVVYDGWGCSFTTLPIFIQEDCIELKMHQKNF